MRKMMMMVLAAAGAAKAADEMVTVCGLSADQRTAAAAVETNIPAGKAVGNKLPTFGRTGRWRGRLPAGRAGSPSHLLSPRSGRFFIAPDERSKPGESLSKRRHTILARATG